MSRLYHAEVVFQINIDFSEGWSRASQSREIGVYRTLQLLNKSVEQIHITLSLDGKQQDDPICDY